ncbi:unnamed protein product [Vicia faba]|uniref:Early nodulin-like protein 2 n=1 Tax=Vicia faba TaxID=3906 RepID=A0A173H230_VICFA|nr:early nodulin-like protein 2 [Vicia faba]CAI8606935.1 unnamed protein product [Vicia faba]
MDFKTPLFLLFVLGSTSQALKFDIGGTDGWSLNPSENYNEWSGRNRFQVNDVLVFKYKKGSDSVLEVTKEAYDKCNKTNPIKKLEDGNTEFTLDRSGPFYFISGTDQNCEKGQKLNLVVISPRGHTPSSAAPSPSTTTPSPSVSPLPSATTPSPSVSTSPTANSPSVSTPPAGEPTAPPPTAGGPPAPSPMSPSMGASPPSQSPTVPSDGAAAPGAESPAPGATAVPPASSDSIAPSSSLVYSVAVVVGAVFLCY